MEELWKEEAMETWPTKEQVRIYLGVTLKTIERWQKDPQMLRRDFRLLSGHKRMPIYNPSDVRRIKSQKLEPIVSDTDTTRERQEKPKEKQPKRQLGDTNLVVRMSPHVKIYLSLTEAKEYSGLPKGLLKKKIHEKKIAAVRMGAWRIRRDSLERYDAVSDTVMSLSYVVPQIAQG